MNWLTSVVVLIFVLSIAWIFYRLGLKTGRIEMNSEILKATDQCIKTKSYAASDLLEYINEETERKKEK